MRLIQFGDVILPEQNAQDDLPVNFRSALIQLENGAIDQDGQKNVLESGRLSRKFEVNGTQENDSIMMNLMKVAGQGRNILRALLRDGVTELVTYAKVTDVRRTANASEYDFKMAMTFSWVQDYPFWLHGNDGWYLDTGEHLDSGLYLDGHYEERTLTSATVPQTFGIDNPGTARVLSGELIFQPAAASSITNPKVENLENGLSVEYTGTVAAGESLIFDLATRTIELEGASALDGVELSGPRQVDWMALELGSNTIRLRGTVTGTVKFYYRWQRHYL